ncbi:hypothetical protein L2D01_13515 [Hyphomonadaceae bacterium ML37]|nr:hypothetical protein L2D01_13515 [Hyphomonadaceae bacterium ML37]
MADVFASALRALFDDPSIGHDAVYVADGGGPLPVRIVARRADAVMDFEDARLWSESVRIDVLAAEISNPRPGDMVVLDGASHVIEGEPVRDRERLTWTLTLRAP